MPRPGGQGAVKRVLLVEDDADVGYVLDLLLGLAGYAARRAAGVEAARHALALGTYDLALVDRVLPDGDGLAICREVHAACPQTPVIVLSARATPAARDEALAAGAAHFVAKPFDPDTLERVVRITLGDAPDRRRTPRTPGPRAP
jgi:two-component system OmpR family response regulator